jgi:hypothetical protein
MTYTVMVRRKTQLKETLNVTRKGLVVRALPNALSSFLVLSTSGLLAAGPFCWVPFIEHRLSLLILFIIFNVLYNQRNVNDDRGGAK